MEATSTQETTNAVATQLTFLSPAFVLAVLFLILIGFVALLIYRASARPGGGEILKQFATPSFVMSIGFLSIMVMCLWLAFYGPYPLSGELLAAIIGAIVIAGIADLRKHWLNSTADSERKNETVLRQADTINALARSGTGDGAGPRT
jgi:uncharacterized membrane-anchored protein YitT (DUF2179 family)